MAAAAQIGPPLMLLVPQDRRIGGRYEGRLTLIRPDQHVAWRENHLPQDTALLLRPVTGY